MHLEKTLKIILGLVSVIAITAALYSLITKENIFVSVILSWTAIAIQSIRRKVDRTSTKENISTSLIAIIIGYLFIISITYILLVII